MKKTLTLVPRKLNLRREALRRLDLSDAALRDVAGAVPQTDACDPSDACPFSYKCNTQSPAPSRGGGQASSTAR